MKIYDVIVVGGGAAGLMAAGRAAELKASVLLLEKKSSLGIKLLMTGGGRCNFTNQSSPRFFANAFGANGPWLLSGLSRFGPNEVINFFEKHQVKIKVEDNGRVFPVSNRADEILKVLIDYIKSGGGEIKTASSVVKIVKKDNHIVKLILEDGTEIIGRNYILATGGKSYPSSGSSGDAQNWLKNFGHTLIEARPALSRIIIKENSRELEGLSFKNVSLCLYQFGKKIKSEAGDFIFTINGLSGPAALNLSRTITRRTIKDLQIKIDFFPDELRDSLDKKIKFFIDHNKQSSIKNILGNICLKSLADFALQQIHINSSRKGSELTRLERLKIIEFFKAYNLSVLGLGGFNEAMITSGGVCLKEVDPKTMASKIINNLYLAGEILNLDGPSGGYNLQVAWMSGYLAGESTAV